ncbi:MAG: VOC family protein [Polyangiaceae bacterium]
MLLSQVRLLVRDFPTMFRFYRDAFGLEPQLDDERGPYGKFEFPSGTAALALQTREHFEALLGELPHASTINALVVVHVDDVDALVATLRSRGALIQREPADAWGRMRVAYVRDPEGNLIELQQWYAAAKPPAA